MYQNNLKLMKSSEYVFDYVHFLYYKCYKKYPDQGESRIGSPDMIKTKKVTINPINKKDNNAFNTL